jgi:hypothetical protein
MAHEDDLLDTTLDPAIEFTLDPHRELEAVLDDLEALLKNGEVIGALTGRGINASLALIAAGGLRAYLAGKKAEAAEDLSTAADEIRGRIQAGHQA